MIGTIVPQFPKLLPQQKRLWPGLRPSVELGFVLYGGTAVYFQDGDLAALAPADRNTMIGAAKAVGPLPPVKLRSNSLAIAIGSRRSTGKL